MSQTPRSPFTLRDLPLPAKLVISVFLLSVGLGYFSALVQLHMKHSDMEGSPLPTPDDVVERFSRFTPFDGKFPKSKIEALISGDRENGWGKANMTPAFFGNSDRDYKKVADLPTDDPKRKKVDDEREGERLAVIAFINSPTEKRKEIYDADAFELPADLKDRPITEDYLDGDKVLIQSIIADRCGRCHDNEQSPNFANFEQLEPLITAPVPELIHNNGTDWVLSEKTMSVEGLTQSTHAHLLSFSVLFALTGLVYAFTSHPGLIRGILAPIVLLAQVADVSCWWLARLDLPYGPMFALTIMGTGGVVGLGLALQIVLSLFNMYGIKGKLVLLILFLTAGGGFSVLYTQKIEPELAAQKLKVAGKTADPATEPTQAKE